MNRHSITVSQMRACRVYETEAQGRRPYKNARYGFIWRSLINEAEKCLHFGGTQQCESIAYKKADNSDTTVSRVKKSLLSLAAIVFMCLLPTSAQSCTNPVGVAGDMVYNDTEHVMQWCDGTNWNGVGRPPYIPNAVNFNGSSDWLTVSVPTINGGNDSKVMTASFWWRQDNLSSTQRTIFELESRFIILTQGTLLRITADNSSATDIFQDSFGGVSTGEWRHFLISFDLSNPANYHVYIDGVDQSPTASTYADDSIDLSPTFALVGSDTNTGSNYWEGDIADLWIDFGTYLDLSDPAIRAQFIDANGFPVDLGSDGSKPTGASPDFYLSGDTATWHTNDGTGGGFTENGALTDALTDPGENLGPTGGLVGWWKLDETSGTTATDSSPSGNDGTMNGGLDAGNDSVDGAIVNGLNLDGANDYISIGDFYDTSPDITISAWVNARNFTTNGNNVDTVIAKELTAPNSSFILRVGDTGIDTNRVEWVVRESTGAQVRIRSNARLDTGRWYHLVVTHDNTGRGEIYIDGVLDNSSNTMSDGTMTNSTSSVEIGRSFAQPQRIWSGLIDDVRIYDRALDSTEVAALYNTGIPCQNPDGFRGGDIMYNSTHHIPQYCNLREWKSMAASPGDGDTACDTIGEVCPDGSVFVGVSLDGNVNMYTTPADAPGTYPWNNGNASGKTATGTTDDTAGEENTEVTVTVDADSGTAGDQPNQAAQYCYDLTAHGNSDWYLPADTEISTLYTNRVAIGGFTTNQYWASREIDFATAQSLNFASGILTNGQSKEASYNVRCVRKGLTAGSCTNPTGDAGDFSYNTTHDVMTYCEGDQWKAIGVYN